jgi:hypothetical protein
MKPLSIAHWRLTIEMTPQSAIRNPQSAIADRPAIDFCGVRVYATRHGDRVTGRVEFPAIFDRPAVPLSYQRREASSVKRISPDASPFTLHPSRANPRLTAVHRYQELLQAPRGLSRTAIADQVAAESGVTRRTIQLWNRRFEIEGAAGLDDHYVPAPARVVTCDSVTATDAVLACAWWAFRIANCPTINTRIMATAATLLGCRTKSDVLAAIDCYFAWPCDRVCYPFKPFSRWARHDFDQWLFRARDDARYLDAVTASKHDSVPLQSPIRNPQSAIRNPQSAIRNRRRLRTRATRQAIATLKSPSNPARRDRKGATNPNSSIYAALGTLSDAYRGVLLSAAYGDRPARHQAAATMSLWWSEFPDEVCRNIEARVEAWSQAHPGVSLATLATRKTDMLLAAIRRDRRAPRPIATFFQRITR